MQSKFRALPANKEIIAPRPLACARRAIEGNWLAALQCRDPVDTPASDHLVQGTSGAGQEVPTLAERKLVAAAEVKDVSYIERGQTVITLDSETWHGGGAVALQAASVEQVAGVRACLGESVSGQEIQPASKLLLNLGLQGMVYTVALGRGIASAFSEIMKRQIGSSVGYGRRQVRRDDLARPVRAWKGLQMTRQ